MLEGSQIILNACVVVNLRWALGIDLIFLERIRTSEKERKEQLGRRKAISTAQSKILTLED